MNRDQKSSGEEFEPSEPSECVRRGRESLALSAYALGEHDVISAGERQRIDLHLETCAACRDEVELLRATARLVAEAGDGHSVLEPRLQAPALDEFVESDVGESGGRSAAGEVRAANGATLDRDARARLLRHAAKTVAGVSCGDSAAGRDAAEAMLDDGTEDDGTEEDGTEDDGTEDESSVAGVSRPAPTHAARWRRVLVAAAVLAAATALVWSGALWYGAPEDNISMDVASSSFTSSVSRSADDKSTARPTPPNSSALGSVQTPPQEPQSEPVDTLAPDATAAFQRVGPQPTELAFLVEAKGTATKRLEESSDAHGFQRWSASPPASAPRQDKDQLDWERSESVIQEIQQAPQLVQRQTDVSPPPRPTVRKNSDEAREWSMDAAAPEAVGRSASIVTPISRRPNAEADSFESLETTRRHRAQRSPTQKLGFVTSAGGASGATSERKSPLDFDDSDEVRRRFDSCSDAQRCVQQYCEALRRKPDESLDKMFFRYWGTHPFVETRVDPLSTFAADVDTASYTLTRSYLLSRNLLPPPEAIRTEEFINYFREPYVAPAKSTDVFSVTTEMAPSPFAHEPQYELLKIDVQGRRVDRRGRRAASLVFVIDASGSMARENRLELVKSSLRLLVGELDEGDTIGIVAFDTTARSVLESTGAENAASIFAAIGTLQPGRSTNVEAGLTLGYEMAARHLQVTGTNRVILLSDGVANTGATHVDAILKRVRQHRARGILLSCIGVGMGNHNDVLMEQLADRGDGHCVYVDRLEAARRAFVDNLTGTLETIARDVKLQIEFDAAKVARYRLLGYENRAIADRDFRDDAVDAGEVGAGHQVTALYELRCRPEATGRLATVRVRYLAVDDRRAVELEHGVEDRHRRGTLADASAEFRLKALIAEFAEILRSSYWARGSDLSAVAAGMRDLLAANSEGLGHEADLVELTKLMERAAPLVAERRRSEDEVAVMSRALRENRYLKERLEATQRLQTDERREFLRQLEIQNRELRQRLEEALRERGG